MLAQDVRLSDDDGISQGQPWCQVHPLRGETAITVLVAEEVKKKKYPINP